MLVFKDNPDATGTDHDLRAREVVDLRSRTEEPKASFGTSSSGNIRKLLSSNGKETTHEYLEGGTRLEYKCR